MRLLLLSSLLGCADPDPGSTPAPTYPDPTTPPTTPVTEAPPAPRCAPEVTPAVAFWIEGDTVSLDVDCTDDARAGFVLEVLDGPPGVEVDGWSLRFPTGLADSGPVTLFLSISSGQGVPETLVETVWISEAPPGTPGNVPTDPAVYTSELGLPVLHLDPDGAVGQDYVAASAHFDGVAYPDARMKVRGAASAGYPKPSYTLAFDGAHLDGSALGMPDKDHLVLISNFDDNSHLRQKLIYDTWADLADFWGEDRPVLRTAWVVVYLGGAYQGLFLAIDHVDDEFFDEHGLSRDGNLYKSVSHDANFYRVLASGAPKTALSAGWEKKEGLDPSDFSDLDALTAFSADSDHAMFAAGAADWIAVPEFMDWFLLVAYSAAADSAGKNAYLYHDPASPDPFRYVPWDFNHAWGQSWTTARVPVDAWSDYRWNNGIFDHFQSEPSLSAELWSRYDAASAPGAPLDTARLLDRVDAYAALTAPSARRDWAVWRDAYLAYGLWSSRTDVLEVDAEVAYVRDWVAARGAVVDSHRP